MRKQKIMVVDDEDYHRNLVKTVLEKLGYQVKVCASPIEALALLESQAYPVIITDLIMYEMDGVEFCEKIRETNKESKIFALSGFIELYESEKIGRAGFDGLLSKPIQIDGLKKTIAEAFASLE